MYQAALGEVPRGLQTCLDSCRASLTKRISRGIQTWICGSEPDQDSTQVDTQLLRQVPPFLVISAEQDLGLEADARRFVTLLERAKIPVEYIQAIPKTNHASVCWEPKTHEACAGYVHGLVAAPS